MAVKNRKQNFSHKVENIGTIYQTLGVRLRISFKNPHISILKDDSNEDDFHVTDEEEENEIPEEIDTGGGGTDHYLLSDGKTYIVILCVIIVCGTIVLQNIFFPNKEKLDNQKNQGINEEFLGQPDGRGAKPFLHPTMKVINLNTSFDEVEIIQVRSLMGEDVDYINEQITRVTRLPNSPDRSLPHLGKTGHISQSQQQEQHHQQQGFRGAMGSFSVIVPIYLGAIFVFFIYIVAKIMMKKFDDKEEVVEEVDPKEAYKDDGWWGKITERINKVGECVKKGTDLEVDEEEEKKASITKKNENSGEFDVLKHRLDRTEESLNNLGIEYC